MILVVMGSNKETAEQYIDQMMELYAARTQRLSAHHITDAQAKIHYLQRFMTDFVKYSLNLTLIPHCYSADEMAYYRNHGAYVAHIHGALSHEHNFIAIRPEDLIVRAFNKRSPDHAFSQSELMSELIYRHRKTEKPRHVRSLQTANT